ncbi:hypothetical protein Thal_0529 [Thermocrinis albus DSM 14484]|uniref:Uncharacterized protein n=1 Tax=Thermocrinis albus (strain DSM 14484 / JCM 11386 / HI 11/12) TaxID=638303 RepID=D3SPS6_THEAH|nr:prepilin-type N-terminal cleavage/methylation domain-containing protein [Thermocrinis albus]ADC89163.1 hypothetical protein Thal_0529 [Thermocrinis albus DSM 14484]
MRGSKGFILVEVLVALMVLAVGFTTLFSLMGQQRRFLYTTEKRYRDMLTLTDKLAEGRWDELQVKERSIEEYPGIKEVTVRLGDAEIYLYTR